MTPDKNTEVKKETKTFTLAFPNPDDWKNIVHDLKLTTTQERELDITIRRVLADIEYYQALKSKSPPRDDLVAALKRLEKALGKVQSEMARSKHLMSHFLSNNTLEFIGKSFTFSAIGQAIEKDVFLTRLDHDIRYMIEKNNAITMAELEAFSCGDRMGLSYKHGAEILCHFIDVIHADLKSWTDLKRRDTGGHPADNIFRSYIIQRLAARSSFIVGRRATTTPKGKFAELCIAVLPACGFHSDGIEKAIEAVLGKMKGQKIRRRRKRKAKSE